MDKTTEIEYLDNPFKVVEGVIKQAFKRIHGEDYTLADVNSGEVSVFTKASKNKRVLVDTGNYVKVYKEGIKVLIGLSHVGRVMFLYIAANLKPHMDTVVLESSICGEWCDCKRSTYFTALSELIEKNIIARKKGSSIEFFVNINYVFNGSRLKLRG